MKGTIVSLVIVACVSWATATEAAVQFYSIDSDPGAWAAAVAGMTSTTAYDFGLDADYGVSFLSGPLTSAGQGPVSPGVLADGVVIDVYDLGDYDSLAAVGASIEPGLASNAVISVFFVDGFVISSLPGTPLAFQFNAVTFRSGDSVDITVNGSSTFAGKAPGNMGILVTDGTPLLSVRIYDPADGAEGVQGLGTLYYGDGTPAVPVPGSLLLGGLGAGLVGWIRRRRLA